jgi:hypothetical protein
MGGFGGGRDSGNDGNTNRERGAVASRSRSRTSSKSKSTKSNDGASASALINVLTGVSKMVKVGKKKNKEILTNNKLLGTSDYQGDIKKVNFGSDGDEQTQAQGIELAKTSTGSATILGPAEIQKKAANNISGPTTTEMSADLITLANKRKGRRSTNITAKKTLANNYALSKKTLLG